MVLSKDQQQLRDFLKETIPFLCKSRLDFRSKFTVEAIIGVTVDESDLFYVSLNEDVSAEVVPKLILERPAGTSQFQKVEVLIDHTLVDVAGDEEYHPKKKKKKTALKRGRKRPGSPLLNMSVDEGDMTSNLDSTEIDLDFIKTEMAEPDFESALDDSFIDKSELDDSALDPLPGTSAGPSLLKDGVEDDGDYSDEGGLDDYSGGDHSDQDGTFDSAKDVEASGSIPAKSDNISMGHLDLKCEHCDFSTRTIATLENHLRTMHPMYMTINNSYIHDLDLPLPAQEKAPLICHICGKHYSTRGGLHEHVKMHSSSKPFKCDFPNCGSSFTRKDHFNNHRNIHKKLKAYKCSNEDCMKAFYHKQSLKAHMATCSKPSEQCVNVCVVAGCNLKFNTPSALSAHRRAKHSDCLFRCSCGKSYDWRTSFIRHQKKTGHSTSNLPMPPLCLEQFH